MERQKTDIVNDYVSSLGANDLFSPKFDRELRDATARAEKSLNGFWYSRLESMSYGRSDVGDLRKIGYFDLRADAENAHNGLVHAKSIRRLKVGAPNGSGIMYPVDATLESVKLGKIIKAAFPDAADHEIAKLVDCYKAAFDRRMTFEYVTGEAIRFWYDAANYAPEDETYTLGNSCMRYPHCQKYLDIYVENPDQVKLAIARCGDRLMGRALVWQTTGGDTYLDRVYGSDATQESIAQWVAENGGYSYSFADDDAAFVSVELDRYKFGYYPYMDSFQYLSGYTLYGEEPDDSHYHLTSTQGGYEAVERHHCDSCDEAVSEYSLHSTDNGSYCYDCYSDLPSCDACGERGDGVQTVTAWSPDGHETWGTFCESCMESAQYCAICDEWFSGDLANHVQYSAYRHAENGPWELYLG